ncbi:MAG: type II toxin-antitoxin system VapC family toxin [Solirubrobacteraceae bacterium]
MRLLLDSHVLIWWFAETRLAADAATAISDPANEIVISAASVWELAIKLAVGRLEVDLDVLVTNVRKDRFTELLITLEHARTAGRLPLHHGDPFDRMLIAQAQLEGLTIVTRDPLIQRYDVATLPA